MKTKKQTHLKPWLVALLVAILWSCTSPATNNGSNDPVFSYDDAAITDAKPWTSENFLNNPKNFQFVIIGDRTGGANQQGTFAMAMDQINLLQPEFVLNVGDLIEGYSDDKSEINAMWDEADSIVGKLQMPFFRTIGNHDVGIPVTKEVWLERYGADYYSFKYDDVLFLVLNTEDGQRPQPPADMKEKIELYNRLQVEDPEQASKMLEEFMTDEAVVAALGKPVGFPEEQLKWIEKTLSDNTDVRWTFLFMHEPCWENPSESFKSIEKMLTGRNYTMFGGHLHYYDYDKINDREYITMGPAGASFHHEGPGNVDHIMWVTMTDEGPQMGNIALKGLFDRKGLDPEMFGAYDRK